MCDVRCMMSDGKTRRFLRGALLLSIIHLTSSIIHSAPASAAAVIEVKATRVTDLVLLDHGFNAGLRQGMVCRISRGTTDIAEVLLVDLRPTCSAALITSVAPKQSIHAGDTASIKILKS
jgi:hypothetical protein